MILNGTQYNLPGYARVKIDGRLTYAYNGEERTPWHVPDDDTNPAWRQSWDRERLIEWAEVQTVKTIILNVEHWPTEQLGDLNVMLEVIRLANPALKLAVWSILPASNYYILANYAGYRDFKAGKPHNDLPASWWELPQNGPTFKAAYDGWRAENTLRAKILGPHVDALCISAYPVVEPPADKLWMGACETELMIAEAKRQCPGKMIFVCWQPHLPGGVVLASEGYARAVIKPAEKKSNGVIVWTDTHVTPEQAAATLSMATKFSTSEE